MQKSNEKRVAKRKGSQREREKQAKISTWFSFLGFFSCCYFYTFSC